MLHIFYFVCIYYYFVPGKQSAFTVTVPVEGSEFFNLKFTSVITDIGQHYSTETGQFTCKYPRIYVFSLHILKQYGADMAACQLRKNNVKVVRAHSDPVGQDNQDGWYSSSTSAVLHMAYGDTADVHCGTGVLSLGVNSANPYNTFSGVLIKAD